MKLGRLKATSSSIFRYVWYLRGGKNLGLGVVQDQRCLDHRIPQVPIDPPAPALTLEMRRYWAEKQTGRKTGTERQGEPGLPFIFIRFFSNPKGSRKRSERREKETRRKKQNKGNLKRYLLMQSSCYPT